jgi:hypothetical protein
MCSYAGQELHQQLDKVLEAHRAAAEALVQQELSSCRNTDLSDTQGTCSGSDSTDSSDSGEVCKDTEECKYTTLCEGSETCSSGDSSSGSSVGSQEGGIEAERIEASHKEAEGGGDRQGSSGSSSGDGGSSIEGEGGASSKLLKALKKRVGLASGDAHDSSSDPEMKVGRLQVCCWG